MGICSLALPVYLGETVQPEVRGTLGLLPTTFGNVGEYPLSVKQTRRGRDFLTNIHAVMTVRRYTAVLRGRKVFELEIAGDLRSWHSGAVSNLHVPYTGNTAMAYK